MRLSVPDWLVERITARAKRTPYRHLPGYMERYWLFRTRWVSCRLHVILSSDDDRALHDHPWDYLTVILRGGYKEITPPFTANWWLHPTGIRFSEWVRPGRVLFRRAESLHRLEIQPGKSCVTLFFTGRRRRVWGFQTPKGWVSHDRYEEMIERGEIPHTWYGAR